MLQHISLESVSTPSAGITDIGCAPWPAPYVLSLNNPQSTVTTIMNNFATVGAFQMKHYRCNYIVSGVGLHESVHSVTTGEHHAVATVRLVK